MLLSPRLANSSRIAVLAISYQSDGSYYLENESKDIPFRDSQRHSDYLAHCSYSVAMLPMLGQIIAVDLQIAFAEILQVFGIEDSM